MWLCKRIQISMIRFNAKVNKNILKLLNYKTFYLILQHSQLTMLWEFHDGQQRDSVIYIYLYPFSPKLRSHPGCHKILSRVSCAIHTVGQCMHVHPTLLNYSFTPSLKVVLLITYLLLPIFTLIWPYLLWNCDI